MLNEKYGLSMDPAQTVRCKEAYYLQMIPEVKPIEPVLAIARKMHGLVPLSIASGGHREVVLATLRALGIESLFTAIVCAEDYVNGKPSPDPFLKAAVLMGLLPMRAWFLKIRLLGLRRRRRRGWIGCSCPRSRSIFDRLQIKKSTCRLDLRSRFGIVNADSY